MNDRSLTCCKLSRRTPFQAELTSHPAIPVGISDVSMRLMPTRRVSGEYSRGKVPNVVVNSRVQRSDYALVSAGHFEQFNNREVSQDKNRSLCASDYVGSDGMRRDNRSPDGSVRTRKKAENQCFSASKRDHRVLPQGLEP